MNIQYKSVEPANNYLKPALRFKLSLKNLQSQEAVLDVSGTLSFSGKIVAVLVSESSFKNVNLQAIRFTGEKFQEIEKELLLVALIDDQTLEMIETSRKADKKGDVAFKLSIRVNYLLNLAHMSYVVELPLNNTPFTDQFKNDVARSFGIDRSNVSVLLYAYQHDKYFQSRTNLLLLSSDGIGSNDGFLRIENLSTDITEKISSSDWIHDFAPALGLGKHFVIEISDRIGTLNEAWKLILEAEVSFRTWNIDAVMTKCRKVGQNLDGEIKTKFGENSFTYNERWKRLYGEGAKGFSGWTSMPLHSEDIKNEGTQGRTYKRGEIKVTNVDAEAALFFTKLLLKYAEELFNEKD